MKLLEILAEAKYDNVAAAIKRAHPDLASAVDAELAWAKSALERPDRINWYMLIVKNYFNNTLDQVLGDYRFTNLDQLHNDLVHFYGYNVPAIERYVYNQQTISEILSALDRELKKYQEAERNRPRPVTPRTGDHVLFDFGSGIQWWFVDRGYCPDEGRSGQHCGNVVGQHKKDQRMLSLRKDGNVLLTFVLEPNNTLGEMKARGNQKPAARYHPYIAKLLMWDRITGITGQGYLPDANFSMFDLSANDLAFFDQNKPQLIRDQCRVTPTEILRAPVSIQTKYQQYIENRSIRKLLSDSSIDNWVRCLVDDPQLILYAPHDIPNFEYWLLDYCKKVSFPGLLLKAPNSIARNPDLLNKIIQVAPEMIAGVNPSVPGFRELCLKAVRKEGNVLRYVPKALRDELMCLTAIQSAATVAVVMKSVPDQIKDSNDILMAAVSADGMELEHVIPVKKRTPALCLAAVQNKGVALVHVPNKFRVRDMCMAAVEQDGQALVYVPEELQDHALLLAAVGSYGRALGLVPFEKRNKEVCMAAVRNDGNALEYVPNSVKNRTICLVAVQQDGWALRHVPDQYRDYQMCLAAVKQDGQALRAVPTPLKDRDLCLAAIRQDSTAIYYVPDVIKKKF